MKTEFPKIHLFICTNAPEKEGKCGNKNSEKLRTELKELVAKDEILKKIVRINQSGCLGQCENGISVVMYPQGKWFLFSKSESTQELLKEIINVAKSEKLI